MLKIRLKDRVDINLVGEITDMNSTFSSHDALSPFLCRARFVRLPRRLKARVLQGHRQKADLGCWPRSTRAISGFLARIDQVLTISSIARVAAVGKRAFWS